MCFFWFISNVKTTLYAKSILNYGDSHYYQHFFFTEVNGNWYPPWFWSR